MTDAPSAGARMRVALGLFGAVQSGAAVKADWDSGLDEHQRSSPRKVGRAVHG